MNKIIFFVLFMMTTISSDAQTNIHESGGNVGIGTPNPIEKLSVRGNLNLETAVGIDNTFANMLKYGYYGDLESGNNYSNR
jgi:hypothetical protein